MRHARVTEEGGYRRGLGDVAEQATVGGAGAGQRVTVDVGQACERERVGGGEVGAQRSRRAPDVVDDCGHEGSLSAPRPVATDSCWTSPSLDFAGRPGPVYYIRVPARVPVGPIAQ